MSRVSKRLSRKRPLLQNHQGASKLSSLCIVVLILLDPTSHLFTFEFFRCNRWSPWFQVKKSQPFTGRKGRRTAGCLFPPSLVSAFLCALVSFSQPGFLHIVENLATRSSDAPYWWWLNSTNSTFPGKESYWPGLGQLVTPKPISCGQRIGHYNRHSLSESIVWSGRKSINPKTGPNGRALVRPNNRVDQIKLLEEPDIPVSYMFTVLVWTSSPFGNYMISLSMIS